MTQKEDIPKDQLCILCRQKYDPNCTWGPCKLTRELEKKKQNGNSTKGS